MIKLYKTDIINGEVFMYKFWATEGPKTYTVIVGDKWERVRKANLNMLNHTKEGYRIYSLKKPKITDFTKTLKPV